MVDLPIADLEALHAALLAQRAVGVGAPLIPVDVPVGGDGLVDAYGLDERAEVALFTGVPLEHTSYACIGGDDG